MLCFSPTPHSYVLIIFMLYEGFEMECIHRCISQTSWWWSRSVSLWAVSPLFIHFTARFFLSVNKFHYRRVSCSQDHDSNLMINTFLFYFFIPSYLCGPGSWFSRPGTCGHMQRQKQVCILNGCCVIINPFKVFLCKITKHGIHYVYVQYK